VRVTPERSVFVILSFEGPDVYSQAGGLGVRVKGLSLTLAQLGYETHLFFIGDPELPSEETQEHGRLHYHRWCQWLSAFHRGGVYDGEEDKLRDWDRSVPAAVIDRIIAPAIESGRNVVVLAEEWQTAATMNLLSDSLYYRGLRDRVVMMWNANNTYGFQRINWGALAFASTITTVSRYMKFRMWEWRQNPIVIPNGAPRSTSADVDAAAVAEVRAAAAADHLCFKIGRFDPDKRWLMAVSAVAYLKQSGSRVRLLIRGGREPHGMEVMLHARNHGLHVSDVTAPDDPAGLARVLRSHQHADVINVTSYISDDLLEVIYVASDAVLANSGHEPFGLVGLEVMAAGGVAMVGSTGEDYADPFRNALVLDTEDPVEIVTLLRLIKDRPDLAASIRKRGLATALDYAWEKVIDQLLLRIDLAAAQQAVRLETADQAPPPTKGVRRTSAPQRRKALRSPKSIT
jgi:glycosyltransferase involved in cell wall biosynthesis